MLVTHPAQIPLLHFTQLGERREQGLTIGVSAHSKIHKINSFSESRSAAVIYWEYSSFPSQRTDESLHLEGGGVPGLNVSASGLAYRIFTYPNVLKTDLAETFGLLIAGQPSLLLKQENTLDQIICWTWDDSSSLRRSYILMETHLVLCFFTGWVRAPTAGCLISADQGMGYWCSTPVVLLLKIFTCPVWNMECRNVHETSCCLKRRSLQSARTNQRLTNAHSLFPAKLGSTRPPWLCWTWGIPEIGSKSQFGK